MPKNETPNTAKRLYLVLLAAGFLLIISSYLPWYVITSSIKSYRQELGGVNTDTATGFIPGGGVSFLSGLVLLVLAVIGWLRGGRGLAWAGLVIGYWTFLILVLAIEPALPQASPDYQVSPDFGIFLSVGCCLLVMLSTLLLLFSKKLISAPRLFRYPTVPQPHPIATAQRSQVPLPLPNAARPSYNPPSSAHPTPALLPHNPVSDFSNNGMIVNNPARDYNSSRKTVMIRSLILTLNTIIKTQTDSSTTFDEGNDWSSADASFIVDVNESPSFDSGSSSWDSSSSSDWSNSSNDSSSDWSSSSNDSGSSSWDSSSDWSSSSNDSSW